MKRAWPLLAISVLAAILLSTFGCNTCPQQESDFNFIFKYGVMARNELDTFQGSYAKDMVLGLPARTQLYLSEEEMDRIYQKMVAIDFFNYPDEFSVSTVPGEPIGMVTPHASYYFKVEYNSQIKELSWDDDITNPDEKADKLRELISLIRDIIESREEYQKLPEPRSGYL
jgi:hypothetical protein